MIAGGRASARMRLLINFLDAPDSINPVHLFLLAFK